MSLLSKYAYYCLLQNPSKYPLGFPIYDSLALESYPAVCKMINLQLIPYKKGSDIEKYVHDLDQLRKAIFGNNTNLFHSFQQFDVLDAYLWRMGKFEAGNLSLLLSKADYSAFVEKIKLNGTITRGYNSAAFNVDVVSKLLKPTVRPFDKIKDPNYKKYLERLLDHWRDFHTNKMGFTVKITDKISVENLKEYFKDLVGGTLRVYSGRCEADNSALLVNIGAGTGNTLKCGMNRTVTSFEELVKEKLGLKVKVFTSDDWVAVLGDITLDTVKRIPRQATKDSMMHLRAYQRDEPTVYAEGEANDKKERIQ